MFLIAESFLNPGDEAIIFDPVDFLFKLSIEHAGATPVCCRINSKTGVIDFDQMESLITSRTKMLWLCNPHNPLGKVFTRDELLLISQIALKHNLWIVSDEIWSNIIYKPAQHISIAALDSEIAKKTLTLFGFSKDFGLAGLSVGYIVSPSQEVDLNIIRHSYSAATVYGVSVLAQVAAETALHYGWDWHAQFLAYLHKMRNYVVERLNNIPGFFCDYPNSTYVLFPKVDLSNKTSQEICDYLLKEARVALVPGIPKFFGENSQGHIRISYATSHKILKEALDRIEQALFKI